MKRKVGILLAGLTSATLMVGACYVYSRRPRERRPSREGLEGSQVTRAFNAISTMPQMRLLRWYVARRVLSMKRHGQAVDIGCGPGHLAIMLTQMAPGLEVTGVDLSKEMLGQAEGHARKAGMDERVQFRQGDAAEIPFGSASLDLVVSTLSLHHWSDPVAVMNEVARVLRPGGAFLIFDVRRDMAAPFYLLFWFVTRCVAPSGLRRVNEPLGSRDAAYTPEEAERLIRRSQLSGWRVNAGPLWLSIEGIKP